MRKKILKIAIIVSTAFSGSLYMLFLLSRTAFFQRGIDLVTTAEIIFIWFPVLAAAICLIVLLAMGNVGKSKKQTVLQIVLVCFITLVSISMIGSVARFGLATEHISADSLSVTSDERFEYRTELVNLFQHNASIRLFIRDLETGEEHIIPLSSYIDMQTIRSLTTPGIGDYFFIYMYATECAGVYNLYTTRSFSIQQSWTIALNTDALETTLLEHYHSYLIDRTEDDMWLASIHIVNWRKENSFVRLHMRDRETREVQLLELDLDINEIIVNNFFWFDRWRRAVSIAVTNQSEVYKLILTDVLLEAERWFEVDMNTGTVTELPRP